MWRDYNAKSNPRKYDIYREVFHKQNIGFGEPPQDECQQCLNIKHHERAP